MIPFYDNVDIEPDENGWVDVDRIYCFQWDEFAPPDFGKLRAAFESLPQSVTHDNHNCHWWYSDREDLEAGYLSSGIEPSGLQVIGSLSFGDWRKWDSEFQQHAADLPVREKSR